MKVTMLTYKGYAACVRQSDKVFYGKLEDIDDLITFQSDSVMGLEEEFHRAVDDYLETCVQVGKTPCVPYLKELEQCMEKIKMQPPEKIFVGHNYGGATWIRAALVDFSERIEFRNVHEIGMEVSVDKDMFDEEFEDVFVRHFEAELLVNKNRFTKAFSDEGRYLACFESDCLEPNFYTKPSVERIIDELTKRGREYDVRLSTLLKEIIKQAPDESYILVWS